MSHIFIKCGQKLKGNVSLFAKGMSKHHMIQPRKGRPVTPRMARKMSFDFTILTLKEVFGLLHLQITK